MKQIKITVISIILLFTLDSSLAQDSSINKKNEDTLFSMTSKKHKKVKNKIESDSALETMYKDYRNKKESDSVEITYLKNKITDLERKKTNRRILNQSLTFTLITSFLIVLFASQAK